MVDRLLAEGHSVKVIDNWTTGRPENLDHQKDNPNLTVYHMDIRNKEEIEPIFQGVDYISILRRWRTSYLLSKDPGIIILPTC